jgi:hypothetical protein
MNVVLHPHSYWNMQLCEEDADFLALVQREKDHLLDAIAVKIGSSRIANIKTYLKNRNSRLETYRNFTKKK